MNKTWWKESIVYQIYPRSFQDSNSDGIGDLNGIYERLDYIKSLGVDLIWLCPVYKSPNDDMGYDISDYRDVMDEFGTLEDFERLLNGIHDRDMKLIMDLVPNHTSDEHKWFQESRKSKDNPYRDYYYWRPGKGDGPPNNYPSFFSGNAWEYDQQTGEYYLHLFSKKQPDLNWENPKVRQEIYDVIKFWLDKGVNGIRMDVISLISKNLDFPDTHTTHFGETVNTYYANGPRIHEYLQEMNEKVLSKYDIMTVGEGPGIDLKNGPNYVDENRNELNMIFHFGHMFMDNGPGGKYDPIPFDLVDFKNIFNAWDKQLSGRGWGSIFLGNHDFPRMISRFGNDTAYREDSGKLLATLLLTLRGTVYLFQGDEIGMVNVAFDSINDYRDIETLNSWKEALDASKDMNQFFEKVHEQSRDNARTPMQWNTSTNAGFSDGNPWLKVNPNYTTINVEEQEQRDGSLLNYYRKMIRFRKEHDIMVYGDYESLDNDNTAIYAYRRWDEKEEWLIVHNFSSENQVWEGVNWEVYELYHSSLSNSEEEKARFSPWESKLFKKG